MDKTYLMIERANGKLCTIMLEEDTNEGIETLEDSLYQDEKIIRVKITKIEELNQREIF